MTPDQARNAASALFGFLAASWLMLFVVHMLLHRREVFGTTDEFLAVLKNAAPYLVLAVATKAVAWICL